MPHASSLTGVTIVGLVVVIALMAMLATATAVSYQAISRRLRLTAEVQQLTTTLQAARDQTISSKGRTAYGVHFETNRYTLFAGTTYSPGAATNEVHNLDSAVQISAVSLGGPVDVTFTRLSGLAQPTGSVTLQLVQSQTVTATVQISTFAPAGLAGTVNPTGTARVVDSRDVHFNLGWSIQSAATLQLTFNNFPSADVAQNVTISQYMSNGQFDWSGTVAEGSANQTIRIHTLSLDASNTVLAIRRDLRYNTKALTVAIDGKQIVFYEDDAVGTPTKLAWANTMSVQ